FFFIVFSSRRRHTRFSRDWSSDVCSSDLIYGIYALPSSGTDEYRAIRNSSVNNTAIPKDLAIHSFNFLAFAMDNFYGLKGIMNVDTYYNLLFSKKNQLLTTTARDYETALFELINKSIDEPHTSYGYPGYYNRASYAGPQLTALGQMGPRGQSFYNDGLYATDDAIAAKWGITGS